MMNRFHVLVTASTCAATPWLAIAALALALAGRRRDDDADEGGSAAAAAALHAERRRAVERGAEDRGGAEERVKAAAAAAAARWRRTKLSVSQTLTTGLYSAR